MSKYLKKYKDDITKVFSIGIEVLKGSRSLQTISRDLKLLAFNGIVQAARIGNKQGQSLITLSGFLSDLPGQISPELNDLEMISRKLSMQITLSSISVRRFMIYTLVLMKTLQRVAKDQNYKIDIDRINFLKSIELNKLRKHELVLNAPVYQRENIFLLIEKNLKLMEILVLGISEAQNIISRAETKIERIRRNGFIADYMGSNISIESAYLKGSNSDFSGLINNIKRIVETLNMNLDKILDKIHDGTIILSNLIKNGIK
jgi:hypothetical protein